MVNEQKAAPGRFGIRKNADQGIWPPVEFARCRVDANERSRLHCPALIGVTLWEMHRGKFSGGVLKQLCRRGANPPAPASAPGGGMKKVGEGLHSSFGSSS